MRKLIAAINMTLDGFCDHTAGLPDEELHQHYTELMGQGDAILYGRTTYQLMEFWRTFLENPSEEKSMNDFAIAIDNIPKIVFSHTLNNVEWKIIQLMKLNLIDEFQLCIHPVVAGNGLPLFENINDRTIFKLVKTKAFNGGAVILYYEPRNE